MSGERLRCVRESKRCFYCGWPLFENWLWDNNKHIELPMPNGFRRHTADHLIPRSKGGSHMPYNLVDCCGNCNAQKNCKTIEEYRYWLREREGGMPPIFYGERFAMPKRLIDGEKVWGSDKLRQVQPEEFRAEYTNLLSLALANGSFECEPAKVWFQVYAYNRPSVTEARVSEILAELERVRLLFRWTDNDGKKWGYWVGIEKDGLLPAETHRNRYKTGQTPPIDKLNAFIKSHIAEPPAEIQSTSGLPPARLALALAFGKESTSSENSLAQEADMANRLKENLSVICIQHDVKPDHGQSWIWKQMELLARGRGQHAIEDQLGAWLTANPEVKDKPIVAFYENAAWGPPTTEASSNKKWEALLTQLWKINPKPFSTDSQQSLQNLRGRMSDEEILQGYREFCSSLDEFDLKHAPRNFVSGGAVAVVNCLRDAREEDVRLKDLQNNLAALGAQEAQRNLPPEEEEIVDFPIQ
jgi:hypothetical protein